MNTDCSEHEKIINRRFPVLFYGQPGKPAVFFSSLDFSLYFGGIDAFDTYLLKAQPVSMMPTAATTIILHKTEGIWQDESKLSLPSFALSIDRFFIIEYDLRTVRIIIPKHHWQVLTKDPLFGQLLHLVRCR